MPLATQLMVLVVVLPDGLEPTVGGLVVRGILGSIVFSDVSVSMVEPAILLLVSARVQLV